MMSGNIEKILAAINSFHWVPPSNSIKLESPMGMVRMSCESVTIKGQKRSLKW